MSNPQQNHVDWVAALLEELGARAAGLWRFDGDRLAQVTFVPCATLPDAVARAFAEATKSVSLDQHGLGIVDASRSGEVAVSTVKAFTEETGSGLWLRKFGASRSIAVPLHQASGAPAGVISVALATDADDAHAVADRLRAAAATWVAAFSE